MRGPLNSRVFARVPTRASAVSLVSSHCYSRAAAVSCPVAERAVHFAQLVVSAHLSGGGLRSPFVSFSYNVPGPFRQVRSRNVPPFPQVCIGLQFWNA